MTEITDLITLDNLDPALEPYKLEGPLPIVWAGDDPENPQWSVVLVFPDQATKEEAYVLSGATETDLPTDPA